MKTYTLLCCYMLFFIYNVKKIKTKSITVFELFKDKKKLQGIIACIFNNEVKSLDFKIEENGKIELIDISNKVIVFYQFNPNSEEKVSTVNKVETKGNQKGVNNETKEESISNIIISNYINNGRINLPRI